MSRIEDFKDAELWTIKTTLRERYGKNIDYEVADSDVRLRPSGRELTSCPLVNWQAGGCHYVIIETRDRRCRGQFYYRLHRQSSTGVNEYDDLTECAVYPLQARAEHERVAVQGREAEQHRQ